MNMRNERNGYHRNNGRSPVWKTLGLAVAFAIPTLIATSVATAKTATAAKTEAAADSDKASLKEEQAKLKDHNKLRAEITRAKYPATKAEVVSHVKGIKADDKKWFEETLPDRTYGSSDEVVSALGWETSPPAEAKPAGHAKKPATTGASGNGEKTSK